MQIRKKLAFGLSNIIGVGLVAFIWATNYTPPISEIRALPDIVHVSTGETPTHLTGFGSEGSDWTQEASSSSDERLNKAVSSQSECTFRLFGVIPLKTITIVSSDQTLLVPGGTAVGISIKTQGVLVVGLGQVQTASGVVSPGAAAGLCAGDRIVAVNGTQVKDALHLSSLCRSQSGGMTLTIERSEEEITLTAYPANDLEGKTRLGIWVRDSTAGVGTLSFYDLRSGWFAALGHAVSDVDTHSLLTIREGKLIASSIVDIIPGTEGEPGELTGVFSFYDQAIGSVLINSEFGIYGTMDYAYENSLTGAIPLGYASQAQTGPATLYTTISDQGVQAFDCEIVRISPQTEPAPKGMVVVVTDEQLLKATGGIVQGMSGSPVVQNGKLMGVVTHVFVNDPTKGYCVFAEWMMRNIP